MSRSVIARAIAALLLSCVLIACAEDDTTANTLGDTSSDATTSGDTFVTTSGDAVDDTNTADTTPGEPFVLRVALYPYLPDAGQDQYVGLLQAIEADFETKHANIDLRLRALDPADDFYGTEQLVTWLTNDPNRDVVGEEGYHMVEIDGLLLEDLVDAGAISAWSGNWDTSDWHPAAVAGGQSGGMLYGITHLLCGHFIFSRDAATTDADTGPELIAALTANPSPAPNLTGNFLGSWNMPSLYIDAWVDTRDGALSDALQNTPDTEVIAAFGALVAQCVNESGANPCVDGTFENDFDDPAMRFSDGRADATFGYSERLHTLVRFGADLDEVGLASIPIGDGKKAAVFVDTFVKRTDCTGACEEAAAAFAAYEIEPEVVAALLLSKDAGEGAIPRFLIPAQQSVYEEPGIKESTAFQKIRGEMVDAVIFPADGFPGRRKALRDEILGALETLGVIP